MSTKKVLLLLSHFVLVLAGACTNAWTQVSLFSSEQFVSDSGDTLLYRMLISDYDKTSEYPLVIFLHGRGERGDDNEAQLKWGVKNFSSPEIMRSYHPIIIAPQCPSDSYWGGLTYDEPPARGPLTPPMRSLLELIDHTISHFSIDTSRIYITGLSMGGYGTYDALSRRPDLFAAAVPICGGGDLTLAATFAHVPIWIFHGALDDLVPPEQSHKMYAALVKAGAHPGLTIYPDAGHFSWLGAYSDPMMMKWLFSQKKGR